jgi:hypothetical protein
LPGFDPVVLESWQIMKPKKPSPQGELFGAQLSERLNPEHPLYVLANQIDWQQFELAIDACYTDERGRPGVKTLGPQVPEDELLYELLDKMLHQMLHRLPSIGVNLGQLLTTGRRRRNMPEKRKPRQVPRFLESREQDGD